ncbi:probable mediator of RNA polymerase II transcription subunit 12 at N-terminal half [Coccomyxa sp. Obi]|nr:probable mediator of RNA polymerase II transcription subunit 12 at N-terminal half [Coccomyxa sp. Obi]
MAGFHQQPLSATLGPPGVYPIDDDAEVHMLNAATLQHGFKESFEAALGISEAKEVDLSLVHRRELWEGPRGESLFQGVWQQLQAAQAAQLDRQRAGRVYDVALGSADVSADISIESDAFPQPPREFRPPPGLGEVAVRAAHARLRALQSRWDLQLQRQWFKELARDTPLPNLARSMFLVHPADPANLAWLAKFQVPPLRAAWYIRIHTIHRGEWHKGEDRLAVRARLWTGDLLRALDEVLDQALPHSSPGSSPPPQPATPPLPCEQDTGSAEAVRQTSFDAWPFASDRPWVVPDLRAGFPPSVGSGWHYYLSLAGYTYREGLVDAEMLVSWLLNCVERARRLPAVMVCLLPLLQLCMQELVQSQLHVRHLLDICCRHLATTSAPLLEGNATQRMHARAKVGIGLTLALRYVLVHCPQSLIGLDLKPVQAALDATALFEDHTCAGLTAAAARAAVNAIAHQATALGCAVNVRVLSYDEAAAVQALEDAMPLMGSAHLLQTLHGRLDRGVPSEEFPSLVVHLACNWASSSSIPSPSSQGHIGSATDPHGPQLPGVLPLRRLFVVDIIRQLAAHLRRQHSQEAATQLPAGVPEPVLQEAVVQWLGELQTTSRLEEAAAELAVDLAIAGLFCPGRYLSTLLARGLLDERRERQAGSSARHRAFLRHLHPQLHLPTLTPPQPPPEKASGPSKTSRSMSLADAERGPPSIGKLQEKIVACGAAETAPVLLQHQLSSESISEISAASKGTGPGLTLRRRSRSQQASSGERWSRARVEYARSRSVVLRGIGAKRKRSASIARENSARASSEEGTSGLLQTKRLAGSKRKRRRRSTSGEGTPDEADELCAEWARKASAYQPAAKSAERSAMEKSPSPDAAANGSSEADRNSSHDEASRSTESPQGDRASQRPVFRTVQKRVAAAMNLELQALSAAPVTDLEFLSSVTRMRPWERRCLARWLANEMRIALMWDGKIDSGRNWHRGDGWLLRGLAVIEEAGGLTEAAALLVLLISRMLRLRRLALPPSGAPDKMWQETGVSERCLLAALAARSRNFAAMGCLAKVLTAVTAWAFAKSGSPLTKEDGVLHFGEATAFAAALLCAYRANPGTAQWWSNLHKTQPQHWLTGLLAARLSSTPTTTDSSPVVALLPATCQLSPALGSATSAASAQVLEEICAVLRSSDGISQVEAVAGHLAVQIGAVGAADPRLPDTEPSGLGVVCAAIVSSYLRIAPHDPEGANAGIEGGGSAKQREAHMQCLGQVSFMMHRQGHQCISAWVQRSICTALTTAKGEVEAKNAALFAAQCVVRGFIDMRCLLSQLVTWRTALGASLASKLLTSACAQTAAGLGAGVELEVRTLNLHHAQLPFQVAWGALGKHLMAEAEHGTQLGRLDKVVLMAILQHAPIQACLLSKPRLLYELLSGFHVHNPDIYAPLAAATALVMGQGGDDGVARAGCNEERMVGLLRGTTAENTPVTWLLLRCLLDDQLMTAARKRMDSRRAQEAAARAFAEADAGMARIGEVEKTFTSQVLATLLEQPGKGALTARLTWALGRGIGEYLLQQADWLLQDTSSLLGHMSLADVLRKRCGVPRTEPEAACQNPTVEDISFGFAELALTGLALSDQSRQRDFALQIVQQLQTLGGLLKAPKQDLGLHNAASADALQSKASGEEVDGNAARKPKGFGGGLGALRARRLSATGLDRQTVGSAEGVHAAIALRLKILMPLLPVVYADRETDRTKNLRYMLARALLPILASPLVYASFRDSKADPDEGKAGTLFRQLLAVKHALLSPKWATWLRGTQEKLRDVPAYEDSATLAAGMKALAPPIWLRDVLHSAMHAIPAPLFAMPPAAPDLTASAKVAESPDGPERQDESNVTPGTELAAIVDPWFFDGGFAECLCAGGQAKAPQWLQGAVRRRPEST